MSELTQLEKIDTKFGITIKKIYFCIGVLVLVAEAR
jgi:hypothetical protein